MKSILILIIFILLGVIFYQQESTQIKTWIKQKTSRAAQETVQDIQILGPKETQYFAQTQNIQDGELQNNKQEIIVLPEPLTEVKEFLRIGNSSNQTSFQFWAGNYYCSAQVNCSYGNDQSIGQALNQQQLQNEITTYNRYVNSTTSYYTWNTNISTVFFPTQPRQQCGVPGGYSISCSVSGGIIIKVTVLISLIFVLM